MKSQRPAQPAVEKISKFDSGLEQVRLHLIGCLRNHLSGIVVFGGAARHELLPGWSDLDLLVITRSIDYSVRSGILQARRKLLSDFGLSSDFVLHTEVEIESRRSRHCLLGSLALNALSGRPATGRVLFGEIELYPADVDTERKAAMDYITQMAYRLRKLFLDAGVSPVDEDAITRLARAIRWTSSLVRCVLRVQGVHSLPYEALLEPLSCLFPGFPTRGLQDTFAMRREWLSTAPQAAVEMIEPLAEVVELLLAKFHHRVQMSS